MMRFQVYSDAMGMEHRFEGIGHLLPDPFLNGEAFGKQVHKPRQLGDADDILVCDITNVCIAEEGESMMLA
jgi:hypothetical protein